MSTTLSNSSDLSTEVAGLKKLVTRLLHLLDQEAGAEQSQTIPEFCRSEKINRAFFYQLQKTGRGPRTMRHADGCIRISPEARTDWRREAEASVEFLSEHNTTPPLKDWPVTVRGAMPAVSFSTKGTEDLGLLAMISSTQSHADHAAGPRARPACCSTRRRAARHQSAETS